MPSLGSDARCLALDDGVTGATAESLSGGVCQISFTQDVGSWTLPASVTKLSVLAIGGGGGALTSGGNGFGGAGGQLNYRDTTPVSDRDFTITIGTAGANATSTAGANGTDTVLEDSSSTALVTAAGGLGGKNQNNMDAAWAWATDGVKVPYGDPGL